MSAGHVLRTADDLVRSSALLLSMLRYHNQGGATVRPHSCCDLKVSKHRLASDCARSLCAQASVLSRYHAAESDGTTADTRGSSFRRCHTWITGFTEQGAKDFTRAYREAVDAYKIRHPSIAKQMASLSHCRLTTHTKCPLSIHAVGFGMMTPRVIHAQN